MTLPFITEQKPFTLVECGNEQTGIIKLVKKGFISVAEQIELDAIAVSSYQYQLMVGELVYRIVKEKEVTQGIAQKAIEKPNENIVIAGDYLSDIKKIWEEYHNSKNNDLVRVTTIVKHRALSEEEVPEFEKFDTRKFMLSRQLIDWGNEQTKELPQALFQEILEFFVGERQGMERKDTLNPLVNETNSSEKEFNPALQTGENASGNSRKRKMKDSTI